MRWIFRACAGENAPDTRGGGGGGGGGGGFDVGFRNLRVATHWVCFVCVCVCVCVCARGKSPPPAARHPFFFCAALLTPTFFLRADLSGPGWRWLRDSRPTSPGGGAAQRAVGYGCERESEMSTVVEIKSELKTMGVAVPRGTNKAGLEKLLRAHVAERDEERKVAAAADTAAANLPLAPASFGEEQVSAALRVETLRGLHQKYKGETFREALTREVKEESASPLKCRPEVRIAENLFEWGAFWGVPAPVVRVLRSGITNVRGTSFDVIQRTFPNLTPKKTVYAQIERAVTNEKLMWQYELEYPQRWVHGVYIATNELDLLWRLYRLPREYEERALQVLADDHGIRDVASLLANVAAIDAISTNEMKAESAAAAALRRKEKTHSAAAVAGEPHKRTGVPARVWIDLDHAIEAEAFLRQALDDRLRICVAK